MLGKEIRQDKKFLRARLEDRAEQLQKQPKSPEKQLNWKRAVKFVEEQAVRLNESVDKYNMHVPLLKMQTVYFDVNREMEKIKSKYPVAANLDISKIGVSNQSNSGDQDSGIKQFIDAFKNIF